MNDQVTSLNLNGLTGDGVGDGSITGYGDQSDQGAFSGNGHGGFGGDEHQFGGHPHSAYGPPGGDNGGSGHGGQPSGNGGDPGIEGPPPPPPPRGKKLALACHFCRRRKLKCDGIRPECDNCAKRGETCSYDDSVRRRGPGKRTKETRQRAMHELDIGPDGQFAAFNLNDPSQQHHMPIPGPSSQQPRPIAPALLDPTLQNQQYDESSIPSSNLPDIDPNIDPALAILGMGLDHNQEQHDVGIPPATLAEADPTRGQKRKSDLVTATSDEDHGKRLRLEDETYEGPLTDHHQGVGVGLGNGVGDIGVGVGGVGVGVGVGVGLGGGVGVGVPDFSAWGTGEGREGEVDEEDLAKFENDLRRVIQDQAEAEAKAFDQGQSQAQGQ